MAQMRALMARRVINARRDRFGTACALLCPVVMVTLILMLMWHTMRDLSALELSYATHYNQNADHPGTKILPFEIQASQIHTPSLHDGMESSFGSVVEMT